MDTKPPPTLEQRRAADALSGALELLDGYPPGHATPTDGGVGLHLRPEHAAYLAVRIHHDVSQGKLS